MIYKRLASEKEEVNKTILRKVPVYRPLALGQLNKLEQKRSEFRKGHSLSLEQSSHQQVPPAFHVSINPSHSSDPEH